MAHLFHLYASPPQPPIQWEQVPVIVAENKVDLYRPSSSTAGGTEEQALARKRQQIISLLQRFNFVRQCIKCSAKQLLRVDDIFLKAQQAVLYPFTPPLYDLQTGQLTVECKRAFTRIFRMYDRDHDGLLSDAEIHRFQRDTYQVAIFERDLAAWKKVVTRTTDEEAPVLQDEMFTIAGFLTIFDIFISHNRLEVVWQALRKFGYDDDLILHVPESVTAPPMDARRPTWRLSSSAKRFLTALFHQFDSNKDGILSAEDILRMFSILPPPALPPWHPMRAPELFQGCFSKPIDSPPSSTSLGASSSTPGSDSPTSLGQSLILPGSMSQSLSNSGISILSAGDSLPSVDVGPRMLHPVSRPLTFLEWMGFWHVVATISPSVARAELFRLGHVEEAKQYSKTELSSLRRRTAAEVRGNPKSAIPTNYVPDATLRSREMRVLVLGSQGSGKTALLNYLRGKEAGPKSTTTRVTTVPETSTTCLKLKRKPPHNKATNDDGEEFVVHLVFTDVPEAAAASQEAHFRNLTELFGSVANPKDRMCDLAMLVFDCTKSSSLAYVKELEKRLLTKETPRVFVGTKADLLPQNTSPEKDYEHPALTTLEAARRHCQDLDLEIPLVTSAENTDLGAERQKTLDHLARCAVSEPGVQRLRARPHEEQKRREAAKRRMMWLGGIVSVGIVVAVGVGWIWGNSKKDRNGSRWFRFLFGSTVATEAAAS